MTGPGRHEPLVGGPDYAERTFETGQRPSCSGLVFGSYKEFTRVRRIDALIANP